MSETRSGVWTRILRIPTSIFLLRSGPLRDTNGAPVPVACRHGLAPRRQRIPSIFQKATSTVLTASYLRPAGMLRRHSASRVPASSAAQAGLDGGFSRRADGIRRLLGRHRDRALEDLRSDHVGAGSPTSPTSCVLPAPLAARAGLSPDRAAGGVFAENESNDRDYDRCADRTTGAGSRSRNSTPK